MVERALLQYDRAAFPQEFRHLLARKYWGSALSSYDIPTIGSLEPENQFQLLAWWAACPIPEEVWNFYKKEDKIPWILKRYDSTNGITRHIVQHEAKLQPDLYFALTSHIARNADEPVGKYEKGHVPNIHTFFSSPMSSMPGYSASRIIALMARAKNVDTIKKNRRVIDEVQKAVVASHGDPNRFIAYLFRSALHMKVDALKLAGHALDLGKLKEERFFYLYEDLFNEIIRANPESADKLSGIHQELQNLLLNFRAPNEVTAQSGSESDP